MKKGFTLIELLVVVLIVGILSAVALPQYTTAVEKARATEAISMIRSIRDAQQVYKMANGVYSSKLEDLDIEVVGTEAEPLDGSTRRHSKYFSYGGLVGTGAIGVANRLPINTMYVIVALENGSILCQKYTEKGEKICKALGKKNDEGNYILW